MGTRTAETILQCVVWVSSGYLMAPVITPFNLWHRFALFLEGQTHEMTLLKDKSVSKSYSILCCCLVPSFSCKGSYCSLCYTSFCLVSAKEDFSYGKKWILLFRPIHRWSTHDRASPVQAHWLQYSHKMGTCWFMLSTFQEQMCYSGHTMLNIFFYLFNLYFTR